MHQEKKSVELTQPHLIPFATPTPTTLRLPSPTPCATVAPVRANINATPTVLLALLAGLVGGALIAVGWVNSDQILCVAGALAPAGLLIVLAGLCKLELW